MKPKCLLVLSPIVAVALMLAANATATPIDYVTNLSDTEIPRTAIARNRFRFGNIRFRRSYTGPACDLQWLNQRDHRSAHPRTHARSGLRQSRCRDPSAVFYQLSAWGYQRASATTICSILWMLLFIIPPFSRPVAERRSLRRPLSLRLWPSTGIHSDNSIQRISQAERFCGVSRPLSRT